MKFYLLVISFVNTIQAFNVTRSINGDEYTCVQSLLCKCDQGKTFLKKENCYQIKNGTRGDTGCTFFQNINHQQAAIQIVTCDNKAPKIPYAYIWNYTQNTETWSYANITSLFIPEADTSPSFITHKIQTRNEYWNGLVVNLTLTCGGSTDCIILKFSGSKTYPLPSNILELLSKAPPTTYTSLTTITRQPTTRNKSPPLLTTTTLPSGEKNKSELSSTRVIIGLVVAALVLIAIIVIAVLCCRKRSEQEGKDSQTKTQQPVQEHYETSKSNDSTNNRQPNLATNIDRMQSEPVYRELEPTHIPNYESNSLQLEPEYKEHEGDYTTPVPYVESNSPQYRELDSVYLELEPEYSLVYQRHHNIRKTQPLYYSTTEHNNQATTEDIYSEPEHNIRNYQQDYNNQNNFEDSDYYSSALECNQERTDEYAQVHKHR